MPSRAQEPPIVEAAISVSEMARRITLSRGRFYELIREGVLPPPCFCIHTRRALYPAELIQQCLQVRTTNIGANGRYVLFYQPRANGPASSVSARSRQIRERQRTIDPTLAALRDGLTALGMASVSDDQIRAAMGSAFPSGTAGIDAGTVLAAVFRLIRSLNGACFQSSS